MIAELALLFMIAFGIGSYAGKEAGKQEQALIKTPVERVNPILWEPKEHREQMLMCRAMCKDGGVLSYDPVTGECQCRR